MIVILQCYKLDETNGCLRSIYARKLVKAIGIKRIYDEVLLESSAAAPSKRSVKSIAAESRINDSDGTVDASVVDRYFSAELSFNFHDLVLLVITRSPLFSFLI